MIDLKAPVEGHDGIFVIRRGETCRDWNGIHYQVGLSEKNVGAHGKRPAARSLDVRDDLLRRVLVLPVVHAHRVSALGRKTRRRRPDATAAARHKEYVRHR